MVKPYGALSRYFSTLPHDAYRVRRATEQDRTPTAPGREHAVVGLPTVSQGNLGQLEPIILGNEGSVPMLGADGLRRYLTDPRGSGVVSDRTPMERRVLSAPNLTDNLMNASPYSPYPVGPNLRSGTYVPAIRDYYTVHSHPGGRGGDAFRVLPSFFGRNDQAGRPYHAGDIGAWSWYPGGGLNGRGHLGAIVTPESDAWSATRMLTDQQTFNTELPPRYHEEVRRRLGGELSLNQMGERYNTENVFPLSRLRDALPLFHLSQRQRPLIDLDFSMPEMIPRDVGSPLNTEETLRDLYRLAGERDVFHGFARGGVIRRANEEIVCDGD